MPGKFLAEFELYVMLAIAQLGENAYGGAVRREIEARTGRPISIGALCATLSRLAHKDLLTLRTARGEAERRGRARRYCRLTPRGAEALRHSAVMLTRMMDGLRFADSRQKSR
jgi:DNA-binding PadR family transcriptional regulator